jgi:hypothetical protein
VELQDLNGLSFALTLLLSDIGLFTGVSLDKSPGDSLLFKQSALRGVSYTLTLLTGPVQKLRIGGERHVLGLNRGIDDHP